MARGPWLADEMLGRLARYLRIVGEDTAYARGLADDAVAAWAVREGRTLLTRDLALAARVPGAILLSSVEIRTQWQELAAAVPGLSTSPRMVRCTLCNGVLEPTTRQGPSGTPQFDCRECHHSYWDGSHTAAVGRAIAAWGASGQR